MIRLCIGKSLSQQSADMCFFFNWLASEKHSCDRKFAATLVFFA